MWRPARLALAALSLTSWVRAQDSLDNLDEALTYSAFDDSFRVHLSGLADAEFYHFSSPPPGFIRSSGTDLFNPRLTLFLDAQAGDHLYFFAQARADRGFDPQNGPLGGDLEEYAVRFLAGSGGHLNVQVGKFATVVGNWTGRHDSWNNPFVTAPLPYDNLVAVWDAVPARSTTILLDWAHLRPFPPGDADANKQLRVPIVWGPSYTTGASVSGEWGAVNYAAEVKNAPLSSRPDDWTLEPGAFDHPSVSARLGLTPDESWSLGVSGSTGPYLDPDAVALIPPGRSFGQYRQTVFAQDATYAWHHFQAWAEVFEAQYSIPDVARADTLSYYVEAKYKFTPQFFGAIRWNQQLYGDVPFAGSATPWGRDVWRFDAAPAYRFTAHLQAKLQGSLEQGNESDHHLGRVLALQLTLRF